MTGRAGRTGMAGRFGSHRLSGNPEGLKLSVNLPVVPDFPAFPVLNSAVDPTEVVAYPLLRFPT